MPIAKRPKLVNRGPAGLIDKLPAKGKQPPQNGSPKVEQSPTPSEQGEINRIALPLQGMTVPISSLTPDPLNARKHPERNMEAIRLSLRLYGQVKPVVVQKSTMTVVAGNGTLQAAIDLGWTKIAAAIIEMDDLTAQGYGVADNRTAELARWDFEVVSRLERLQRDAGLDLIGWSQDELEVLRAADWTPPAEEDYDGEETVAPVKLLESERKLFDRVVVLIRQQEGCKKFTEGECLTVLCESYLKLREESSADKKRKK